VSLYGPPERWKRPPKFLPSQKTSIRSRRLGRRPATRPYTRDFAGVADDETDSRRKNGGARSRVASASRVRASRNVESARSARRYERFHLIGSSERVARSRYISLSRYAAADRSDLEEIHLETSRLKGQRSQGALTLRTLSNEPFWHYFGDGNLHLPGVKLRLRAASPLASLTVHPARYSARARVIIIGAVESCPVSATQIATGFVQGRERRIRNRVRYVNASGSRHPILDIASKLARSIRHGSRIWGKNAMHPHSMRRARVYASRTCGIGVGIVGWENMAREISDSGFMRASSRRRAENINFDVSPFMRATKREEERERERERGGLLARRR